MPGVRKDQLCWEYKNATGGCEWSSCLEPVPGWTAEKVPRWEYINRKQAEKVLGFSYKILSCPKFERG